jgi:hypothetical protein
MYRYKTNNEFLDLLRLNGDFCSLKWAAPAPCGKFMRNAWTINLMPFHAVVSGTVGVFFVVLKKRPAAIPPNTRMINQAISPGQLIGILGRPTSLGVPGSAQCQKPNKHSKHVHNMVIIMRDTIEAMGSGSKVLSS